MVDSEPTQGDEEEFKSGTPKLTPNLWDTGSKDGLSNDAQAVELYADHRTSAENLAGAKSDYEFRLQYLQAYEQAYYGVNTLYDLASEGSKAQQILSEARRLVAMVHPVDKPGESLLDKGDRADNARDTYDANLWRASQHLEQNSEAYENQAVNDYNRAREADPDRYPEPLKFGQVDQTSPKTPPEDQDSPRE